jgi:hypothetical protein
VHEPGVMVVAMAMMVAPMVDVLLSCPTIMLPYVVVVVVVFVVVMRMGRAVVRLFKLGIGTDMLLAMVHGSPRLRRSRGNNEVAEVFRTTVMSPAG